MINFGSGTFTIMFTFNSAIELQLFQSSEENFRKKSLFTSVIGEVQRSNCALREKVQAMFLWGPYTSPTLGALISVWSRQSYQRLPRNINSRSIEFSTQLSDRICSTLICRNTPPKRAVSIVFGYRFLFGKTNWLSDVIDNVRGHSTVFVSLLSFPVQSHKKKGVN